MPKLGTLAPPEVTTSIPMGESETLSVTYRPRVLNTGLQERFKDALADGVVTAQLVDPMCELLVRWDLLYDDRDEAIPITPAALVDIPITILNRVFLSILEECQAAILPAKGRPTPLRRA